MTIADNVVTLKGVPENAKIAIMDVNGVHLNAKLTQGRNGAMLDMNRHGKGIYLINVRGKFTDGKMMNKTVKVVTK